MIKATLLAISITLGCATGLFAKSMSFTPRPAINIQHIDRDLEVSEISSKLWNMSNAVSIDRYWSGEKAPDGRHLTASLLWSATALYVRFTARQTEPLVIAEDPNTTTKTMKLWDRDVAEIFVAPDAKQPKKYIEFEVAPTGEWIDVALDVTSGRRISDWKYASGMETFASVEAARVVMAMKIPWTAFGRTPNAGDIWLGNLFRCVGKDPGRGYLAWSPTHTKEPSFHVPEAFGEFRFVKKI